MRARVRARVRACVSPPAEWQIVLNGAELQQPSILKSPHPPNTETHTYSHTLLASTHFLPTVFLLLPSLPFLCCSFNSLALRLPFFMLRHCQPLPPLCPYIPLTFDLLIPAGVKYSSSSIIFTLCLFSVRLSAISSFIISFYPLSPSRTTMDVGTSIV